MIPLQCPVRGCGQPLERGEASWQCRARHQFDVARSGYVNLLQPQDRRSTAAGDARAAIEARAALLAAGIGRTILDAAVRTAADVPFLDDSVVVDLGCGSGELLGSLATSRPITGIGIDLSTVAAARAARAFPPLTWVVANADRRLPITDASVALATSMHGRRNPAECRRLLRDDGYLLVVVPASDDLIELREHVLGERIERDRSDAVIAEHAPRFSLVSRSIARERHRLEGGALAQLLRGTYRGARLRQARTSDTLPAFEVTLASDLLLFRAS